MQVGIKKTFFKKFSLHIIESIFALKNATSDRHSEI